MEARAAGASLAILAPADLADNLLARFGFSGALVLAGLFSLAGSTRRLEVDTSGITQHGVLGSRAIPSPQVSEIELDEHSGGTSPLRPFPRQRWLTLVTAGCHAEAPDPPRPRGPTGSRPGAVCRSYSPHEPERRRR